MLIFSLWCQIVTFLWYLLLISGEKESDVVYIETEINAEAGKQKVSKKLHPKDSSVQSNNGGHNSNCTVGKSLLIIIVCVL